MRSSILRYLTDSFFSVISQVHCLTQSLSCVFVPWNAPFGAIFVFVRVLQIMNCCEKLTCLKKWNNHNCLGWFSCRPTSQQIGRPTSTCQRGNTCWVWNLITCPWCVLHFSNKLTLIKMKGGGGGSDVGLTQYYCSLVWCQYWERPLIPPTQNSCKFSAILDPAWNRAILMMFRDILRPPCTRLPNISRAGGTFLFP